MDLAVAGGAGPDAFGSVAANASAFDFDDEEAVLRMADEEVDFLRQKRRCVLAADQERHAMKNGEGVRQVVLQGVIDLALGIALGASQDLAGIHFGHGSRCTEDCGEPLDDRLSLKLAPVELVVVGAQAGVAARGDVPAFAVAHAGERRLEDLVEILDDAVNVAGTARHAVVDDEFADPTSVGPAVVGSAEVVRLNAERVGAAVEEAGLEGEPERAILELGSGWRTAVEAELENVGHKFVGEVEAGERSTAVTAPWSLMAWCVWPVLEPPAAAAADQESREAVAAVGAKHSPAALGAVGNARDGVLLEF